MSVTGVIIELSYLSNVVVAESPSAFGSGSQLMWFRDGEPVATNLRMPQAISVNYLLTTRPQSPQSERRPFHTG